MDEISNRALVRMLTSRHWRSALSMSQTSIINNNSNINCISGGGTITNNNWAINITHVIKKQVCDLSRTYRSRTQTLRHRRRPLE